MLTNIIIIALSVLTLGVLFYVVPKLKALTPNIPYDKYLEDSKKLLEIVANLGSAFVTKDQKAVIDSIVKYAELGVNYAEQLYVSGQLSGDQRKAKAIEFVEKALAENGVQLTDGQKGLVDMLIESIVFLLPKSTTTN